MQVTLANWRTAPFNRWAFHHVRELIPSAEIAADPHAVRALPAQAADLPPGLEEFVRETDTDGMAILRRGRLVFERYANGMSDETPHILMSVTKSMLGLLANGLRFSCGPGGRQPNQTNIQSRPAQAASCRRLLGGSGRLPPIL